MRTLFFLCLLFSSVSLAEETGGDTGGGWSFSLSDITGWFLEKFNQLIQVVSDFIASIWLAFINFFASLLDTAFDMLKDLFYWAFDTVLQFVFFLLDSLGAMFSVFNPAQYIEGLPSEILNIMGLIGLGDCFAMIVAAILIRIMLQLIPFTRLGS